MWTSLTLGSPETPVIMALTKIILFWYGRMVVTGRHIKCEDIENIKRD